MWVDTHGARNHRRTYARTLLRQRSLGLGQCHQRLSRRAECRLLLGRVDVSTLPHRPGPRLDNSRCSPLPSARGPLASLCRRVVRLARPARAMGFPVGCGIALLHSEPPAGHGIALFCSFDRPKRRHRRNQRRNALRYLHHRQLPRLPANGVLFHIMDGHPAHTLPLRWIAAVAGRLDVLRLATGPFLEKTGVILMKTILLMIMALSFGPNLGTGDLVLCGAGNDELAESHPDAFDDYGGYKVLLEKESLYHYIRVTESGGVRYMQFRRSGGEYEESAINLADPLSFEMGYYGLMMAAFAHHPAPKSVLFIGLGGGTLSMAVAHYYPDAQVDNIELDPDVAAAATEFFGFREGPRMKVYIRDGRVQVRRFVREKRKYDVIFLDAFRGGYIPYHLTTKEFIESIGTLLTPGGIVVNNL